MTDINKKRFFVTVFSAVAVGLFAHLFGMVQGLGAVDSLVTVQGTGAGITSGRWALEILNRYVNQLWPMWNLTFFNNALAIFILALSAYLILLIFQIDDLYLCALFGGVFLCFPSVCSTFLFSHATVHYAIAVLMSVGCVYLTERYKWGFIPGSLLSAVSIGIYQAYFPMTAALFITSLILRCLREDSRASAILKRAFFYLGTLLLALIEYFVILKIMLALLHTQLSDYQGIDSMGKFALSEIPALIAAPYLSFFKMLLLPSSEAVNTSPVQQGLLILALISAGIIIYIAVRDRKRIFKQDKGILLLFLLLYPAAIYSIRIMCFHSDIHSLMIYAAVLIYLLPVVLLKHFKERAVSHREKKACKWLRIVSIALLSIIILNFSLQSNLVYTREYNDKQRLDTYISSLFSRIQSTPGYHEDMQWVIYGKPMEDYYADPWEDIPFKASGAGCYKLNRARLHIENRLGYKLNIVDDETFVEMFYMPEVQEMPFYPNDGSVKIVNDVMVVKLSPVE